MKREGWMKPADVRSNFTEARVREIRVTFFGVKVVKLYFILYNVWKS